MKTTIQGGVTKVEIIYAAGPSDDKKSIALATVVKQDHLPTEITTRRGDKISVSDDSLDALIIALQQVKQQIEQGLIKRG